MFKELHRVLEHDVILDQGVSGDDTEQVNLLFRIFTFMCPGDVITGGRVKDGGVGIGIGVGVEEFTEVEVVRSSP
ncbi:unnamed protein product [Linum trigynum]|uniref:Uncharacterized protein n=1 Tax=Linum trigynum TaxID=586398 RepID=A0AAV2DZZ2_9ROSI